MEVPFDPASAWEIRPMPIRPGRKGYLVEGKVNGHPFQSAIVSRQRRFFVLLGDKILKAVGIVPGETVSIDLHPVARDN